MIRAKDDRRGSPMVETPANWSRRKLIGAAAMAASLLPIATAQASEKMSRQQAEYQDMPQGIFSCATCSLFEPPKYCKVVEGEVSKDGWCKVFALAD
jgi:succinate dehydrogenase/fumarate reductase-like Fe-S protein